MSPSDMSRDAAHAHRELEATRRLLDGAAGALGASPWVGPDQPPPATDLVRYVVWRGASPDLNSPVEPADVTAALSLVGAARAEVDQLETGLLLLARAHGLTWSQIGRALGLRSAQAAQQRLGRRTSGVAVDA